MPAWRYTSSAHCRQAWGRTGSRPGKPSGSLPRRRAEDPGRRSAGRGGGVGAVLVGDDHRAGAVGGRAGLEVADRVPHHRRALHLLDRDVLDLQVGVGVLERVEAILDRHLPPDVLGRAAAVDVGPDERGEGAAGTERRAPPAAQGELGVALGLLLERHGQDRAVLAGLHVRCRHDAGGAADRAGGVDAEHGLAHRAEGVGEVELGLHHALEQVGGLAEDHGVDVGHRHLGVVEGPEHRLAHETAERHVAAARLVVGLADADHRTRDHDRPSRMQTRFCCRQGPLVAWASARDPPPKMWSAA